ncbi:hypothetical protein CC2G_000301 [Coprinopsis cinerea AmutBmut pab1-1]|nr:hypothetical protein CC2G_000301 [Coprinopsis cinerea AmutBmut pab1-1]
MLRREKDQEERAPNANNYKILAFSNAINVISQLQQPIKSGDDQVLEMKGIGIGIKNRINTYFIQKSLASSENSVERENALKKRAILDLQRVPGIGAVKAKALVEGGCTGLASLIASEEFHSLLSAQQIIGLKYMEHLEKPASRDQVESVLNLCKANLSSRYEIIPVGEYRRGLSESSTIEMLVLHPDHVHVPLPNVPPPFSGDDFDDFLRSSDTPATKRPRKKASLTKKDRQNSRLHSEVVPVLQQRGVLLEKIAEAHHNWTGVVRIPSTGSASGPMVQPGEYRRITLHLVPAKSRAAALVYFTGDEGLHKHLRDQATPLAMYLDEFGLWKWKPQDVVELPISEALNNPDCLGDGGFWSLVKTESEEDIFTHIGVPFVEPTMRNFNFISAKPKPKKKRYSTSLR